MSITFNVSMTTNLQPIDQWDFVEKYNITKSTSIDTMTTYCLNELIEQNPILSVLDKNVLCDLLQQTDSKGNGDEWSRLWTWCQEIHWDLVCEDED